MARYDRAPGRGALGCRDATRRPLRLRRPRLRRRSGDRGRHHRRVAEETRSSHVATRATALLVKLRRYHRSRHTVPSMRRLVVVNSRRVGSATRPSGRRLLIPQRASIRTRRGAARGPGACWDIRRRRTLQSGSRHRLSPRPAQYRSRPALAGESGVRRRTGASPRRPQPGHSVSFQSAVSFVVRARHRAAPQVRRRYAALTVVAEPRCGSKCSPLFHIACRSTASLRATATTARFFALRPPRAASASPQVRS
jgi:hypothetical protein